MRYYSGMATRQRLVIRDGAAWADVWKQITSPFQPVPPVPEVDFAKNVLILAAMGTRSSGGYSIAVDEVHIVAGGARVSVTEVSPARGASPRRRSQRRSRSSWCRDSPARRPSPSARRGMTVRRAAPNQCRARELAPRHREFTGR